MWLVAELLYANLPIVVVNPTRARRFAEAAGRLAKTDKLDAGMIAWFAQAIRPEVRPLRTEEDTHFAALIARRRQVVDIFTAEKNRRHTTPEPLTERLEEHIVWLHEEIAALEQDIGQLIKKCKAWQEKEALLLSVPGVGPITSFTLLAEYSILLLSSITLIQKR